MPSPPSRGALGGDGPRGGRRVRAGSAVAGVLELAMDRPHHGALLRVSVQCTTPCFVFWQAICICGLGRHFQRPTASHSHKNFSFFNVPDMR